MDYKRFEELARKVRIDVIKEVFNAGSGHPGGSLSAADIVTAAILCCKSRSDGKSAQAEDGYDNCNYFDKLIFH